MVARLGSTSVVDASFLDDVVRGRVHILDTRYTRFTGQKRPPKLYERGPGFDRVSVDGIGSPQHGPLVIYCSPMETLGECPSIVGRERGDGEISSSHGRPTVPYLEGVYGTYVTVVTRKIGPYDLYDPVPADFFDFQK